MKYFVATIVRDYADEFDTHGIIVTFAESKEEVRTHYALAFEKQYHYGDEVGFGTNEAHEYVDRDDLLRDLNLKEITKVEYTFLKTIFGSVWGITPIN